MYKKHLEIGLAGKEAVSGEHLEICLLERQMVQKLGKSGKKPVVASQLLTYCVTSSDLPK